MNESDELFSFNFGKATVKKNGKFVMQNGKILDENWRADKTNMHRKWLKKKRRKSEKKSF